MFRRTAFIRRFRLTLSAAVLSALLLCTSCGRSEAVSDTRFMLDTSCTVTLTGQQNNELLESCFELIEAHEHLFSRTLPDSDIYALNHAGGTAVSVDSRTVDLLELGMHYSVLSDGSFDLTVGALTSLWDFSSAVQPPSAADIAAALDTVDYHDLLIDRSSGSVCLLDPAAALDTGGIAKGYIADRLIELLQAKNTGCAWISLGGNVVTLGRKPDGSPWNIGVEQPFSEHTAMVGVLSYSCETPISVVTSGIYERNFTYEGVLYHHILDPHSGYPCDSGLTAVTVVSDSSADGDALSTICLLLGYDRGDALLRSLHGIHAAIWQTADCSVNCTDYDGLVSFTPQK